MPETDIFFDPKIVTKTEESVEREEIIGLEIVFQEKGFTSLDELLMALKGHHPTSHIHSFRVANAAALIAQEVGLQAAEVKEIYVAGTMHDVGKIYVPEKILSKRGLPRENDEFPQLRQHPVWGFDLIDDIGLRETHVARFVKQHHERLDGTGYPMGLNAEDILFGSKILMVADELGALCEKREYKERWSIEDALAEIQKGRNKLFDPTVVDALVNVCKKVDMNKRLRDWFIPPVFE